MGHLPLQAPRKRRPRLNARPPPTTAHRGEAFTRGLPTPPLLAAVKNITLYKCLYNRTNVRVPYTAGPRSTVYICDRMRPVSSLCMLFGTVWFCFVCVVILG